MTEEPKHRSLLTAREREIFNLLVDDQTTKDIAGRLGISEKTVRNHISNTIQKLGVSGRAQAIIELLRLGELQLRKLVNLEVVNLVIDADFSQLCYTIAI